MAQLKKPPVLIFPMDSSANLPVATMGAVT